MAPKPFVALDGVELLPLVAARLEEAVTGLGWSKSHVVNDSLIRTLGLEGLGLSNDQVWGPKKKKEEVKWAGLKVGGFGIVEGEKSHTP